MKESLWESVAVKCLDKAEKLLSSKSVNADDVQIVRGLVDTAIAIDAADHKWKSMDCVANEDDRLLLGTKKEAAPE